MLSFVRNAAGTHTEKKVSAGPERGGVIIALMDSVARFSSAYVYFCPGGTTHNLALLIIKDLVFIFILSRTIWQS